MIDPPDCVNRGTPAEAPMTLRKETKPRALWLTWDRAPLNVLDIMLLRELDQLLTSCAQDDAVDIVILQGTGPRAFSAGVDIKDHTVDKVPEMLETMHGVIRKLLALPQVTIALVRGACLGGGCEVASCCDFIVASEDSVFATPEIMVGCYPPVALARFARLIGYHRAAEMILTGRRFTAREAQTMGLIQRVGAGNELDRIVQALVDDLLAKSSAVLRLTVKGLREISLRGFNEDLKRSEEIYCNELLRTEDVEEGVQAFLHKRPPRWHHR